MKRTILTLLHSMASALRGKRISFQQLPPGDTLHVTFTSKGCFGGCAYEFEFQRASTTTAMVCRVYEPNRFSDRGRIPFCQGAEPFGTATLTDAEVAGLDRLLAFYRSKQTAFCTTVDQITLAQTNGNTTRATESYRDATGLTGPFGKTEMKNITCLPSIAKKARPT